MLASPLFSKSMIPKVYRDLYKKADAALPKGVTTHINNLQQSAEEVIRESSKGGSVSWQNDTKRFAKSLLGKSKNNRISVDELWTFKKQLNDKISRGVFADKKRQLLQPMEKAIRSGLDAYGLKNKDFGTAFKQADILFGIDKGLPILDKAMNKIFNVKDSGLGEYFRKALVYGTGGLKGLAAKKGLAAISKGTDAVFRSEAFRNASFDLAKSIAKQSIPSTVDSLNKLKSIKREFDNGFTNKSGTRFKYVSAPSNTELKKKLVSPEKNRPAKFKPISKEQIAKMRGA